MTSCFLSLELRGGDVRFYSSQFSECLHLMQLRTMALSLKISHMSFYPTSWFSSLVYALCYLDMSDVRDFFYCFHNLRAFLTAQALNTTQTTSLWM